MDIHSFKIVNSICGVAKGDEALRWISENIRGVVGYNDISGHINADRFVIFFADDKINKVIRKIETINLQLIKVSESLKIPKIQPYFGVTKWEPGKKVEEAYGEANFAKNRIKERKDVLYQIYSQADTERIVEEKQMEDNFYRDLNDNRFEIWYQPKYAPKTNKLVGAEGLVRWRRENNEIIPPSKFIPLFERNGMIKEEGILAGIEIAKEVFHRFDPEMKVEVFIQDGTHVKPGDVAMVVEGKIQSLLQTERLMLNIMQRMSGIATMTSKYVERLKGTKTRVLDTRKTTPGMRILEKMAVKIGGGVNHRIGLFDMILLKDNHVDFAGGIDKAITRAKEYCKAKGKDLKIEIEVRNFDELQQVLDLGGVDRIMLDNFTPENTRKAVEMVGGRVELESSGGITFDTLRDYAECGVDYISVGALTHSVKGLDMSFKAC